MTIPNIWENKSHVPVTTNQQQINRAIHSARSAQHLGSILALETQLLQAKKHTPGAAPEVLAEVHGHNCHRGAPKIAKLVNN